MSNQRPLLFVLNLVSKTQRTYEEQGKITNACISTDGTCRKGKRGILEIVSVEKNKIKIKKNRQ